MVGIGTHSDQADVVVIAAGVVVALVVHTCHGVELMASGVFVVVVVVVVVVGFGVAVVVVVAGFGRL